MKKNEILIAPSVLSADFRDLRRQIGMVEEGGADWIHLDIMDGHFVPNITFGPMIVRTIRSLTELPLDAHLMIEEPDLYIDAFSAAGVDRLTVHVETCPHLHRTVQRIRELGMKPGVTLNPATPIDSLREIATSVDLVLVMTVNPGFGGQAFIPSMIGKIEQVHSLLSDRNPEALLEVDGGVDASNAARLVRAGARVLVAGNSIFSKKNIPQAVRTLRKSVGP